MTAERTLCQCGRPVDGASLCQGCAGSLREAINDIPHLAAALDAAYLRQQRFSVSSLRQRGPDESTVPFNARASRLRRELSRELLRWVMRVQLAAGEPWRPVPAGGRGSVQAMSDRLTEAMPYLRTDPTGADAHRAFTGLRERILECVDRPPDLVYLGECSIPGADGVDCPEDLYAEWGDDHARCRRCRHTHRVEERRSVLITAVKDQLANASDISRGLAGLDMRVNADRIRQWKHRDRIVARGHDRNGNPLYRVGDVIDLLLADQEKRDNRKKGKRK